MKLNLRICLLTTFFLLPCSSMMLAQASPEAPPAKPPAMPRPINLKVLPKDIQTGELIELMRGYTKQLGVECEFCHAGGAQPHRLNFADDSKPEKNAARIMITMTNEINAKYLARLKGTAGPDQKANDQKAIDQKAIDQKATCGTCHRGHSQPEAFSPGD